MCMSARGESLVFGRDSPFCFWTPPTEIRKEIPLVFRIKQSRSAGVFARIGRGKGDYGESGFGNYRRLPAFMICRA